MKTKKYLTEVESGFTLEEAMEEAARCLLCVKPPCSEKCPAGTDPAAFIKAFRQQDVKAAAEIIRNNNILAGVCSRVCPLHDMCEGVCRRARIDKPVRIGKLQRFITDYEKREKLEFLKPIDAIHEKVAIIGSGPAALSVATSLALKGYKVTIFESRPHPGGILSYGIAPFRLPQDVVDTEIDIIKKLGVEFRLNTHVGRDISFDELKAEGFEAFVLAMGRPASKQTNVKGIELKGVVNALEYLYSARSTEGQFESGNNVMIIGGGSTAMDCANTAKILGGEHVIVSYRRKEEDMPAAKNEIEHAKELGVEWLFGNNIIEIIGQDEKVTAVKCKSSNDEEFIVPTDTVVFAIGQDAHNINAIVSVTLDNNNQIVVDQNTYHTSVDGVFAAGDSVNGGKTVPQAIAEGKSCAEAIDRYLCGNRENQ